MAAWKEENPDTFWTADSSEPVFTSKSVPEKPITPETKKTKKKSSKSEADDEVPLSAYVHPLSIFQKKLHPNLLALKIFSFFAQGIFIHSLVFHSLDNTP